MGLGFLVQSVLHKGRRYAAHVIASEATRSYFASLPPDGAPPDEAQGLSYCPFTLMQKDPRIKFGAGSTSRLDPQRLTLRFGRDKN
jgi:hypothetical protein